MTFYCLVDWAWRTTECGDRTLHCAFCGLVPKGESANQNQEHLFSRNVCLSLPLDIFLVCGLRVAEVSAQCGGEC